MARQVKNRVHLSDRFKAVKQYAKTYEIELEVKADAFSTKAVAAIEAVGGTVVKL